MCHGVLQYDAAADAWRAGHTCGMTHLCVHASFTHAYISEITHLFINVSCLTYMSYHTHDNCLFFNIIPPRPTCHFLFFIFFHSLANFLLYACITHSIMHIHVTWLIHSQMCLDSLMSYHTHDDCLFLDTFPHIGQRAAQCAHASFTHAYIRYMTHSFINMSWLINMFYMPHDRYFSLIICWCSFPLIGQFPTLCAHVLSTDAYLRYMTHSCINVPWLVHLFCMTHNRCFI